MVSMGAHPGEREQNLSPALTPAGSLASEPLLEGSGGPVELRPSGRHGEGLYYFNLPLKA